MSTNESEDDPPPNLILAPFKMWNDDPYPGSEVIRAGCGHLAWISPQCQQFREHRPEVATMCTDCKPAGDKFYAVPGSVAAVESTMGAQEAAAFRQLLEQHGVTEYKYPGPKGHA